ncbi:MAG: hypothetical protein H0W11_12775, partial [Gemmatimonadetes bacterium]|nr:hypothetical protein [Gemmatimonadota bacterium]
MTPERWQWIQEVFGEAVELPAGPARDACLERACAGDAELRAQIEEMLALDVADASVLDATPLDLADAVRPEEPEEPEGYLARTVGPYRIVREIGRG